MNNQGFHRDTIGEFFRGLPQEFDIHIPLALLRNGSDIPEWYNYDHREFDATGALMHLLQQNGFSRVGDGASSNVVECRGIRKWWNLLIFGIKYRQQQKKFSSTPWKTSRNEISNSEIPCGVAWFCFSKEFTEKLISHAKLSKVSVNSFLLHSANASISHSLLRSPGNSRRWMIPVNLRGRLLLENLYGNHSMWLDAEISEKNDVKKIHKIVHSQLKSGIPWLNYSIATYLLDKDVQMDLEAQPHNCGTQSNLGAWPNSNNIVLDPSRHNDISAIFFVPPIQKSNLLSTGAVSWQGRLALALHTHPALANSEHEVKALLNAWVQQLQTLLGIKESAVNIGFSPIEAINGTPTKKSQSKVFANT